MDKKERELLVKKREKLVENLKKERIEWSEYLHGEGVLAGHAHSLHESQDTKFKLLEKKIHDIDFRLAGKGEGQYFTNDVNGTLKKVFVTAHPDNENGEHISNDSPVGRVLQSLNEGEIATIKTPGGSVVLRLVKKHE